MSRSNPNAGNSGPKNPSELFLRWKAGEGYLSYWDKDREEEVNIGNKIHFAVLDQLHTIGGFCTGENAGYYANEVRDVKKDELTVFVQKRKMHEGTWDQIKEESDFKGKYAQSIYIALIGKKDIRLCNLKLEGSAIGAWISFTNSSKKSEYEGKPKPDLYSQAIKIVGKTELKKQGKSEWYEPIFEAVPISDDLNKKAIELDRELQSYLEEYFAGEAKQDTSKRSNSKEESEPDPEPAMAEEEAATDDLPF